MPNDYYLMDSDQNAGGNKGDENDMELNDNDVDDFFDFIVLDKEHIEA